ncbi:unnamed protein product [Zymoseptoria tritici ST99CH_1E4]|uniref:Uncharacterized protein n=1 Tax=Zymoseptoria tritici ST99CH_1E4 TaxID=1276532 RepID=A0A2H1H9E0_ZYMTR|nr:unnamed protein product [Zymoseptoria tritici ST99CH_1E4]
MPSKFNQPNQDVLRAEAGPSLVVEIPEQVDVGADSTEMNVSEESEQEDVSEESEQEDVSEESEQEDVSEESEQEGVSEESEQEGISEESEQEGVSEESEQEDADGTIVAEKLVIPQKTFAIPTTKVHSKPAIPATKVHSKPAIPAIKVHSKLTTPVIPSDLFATVVADPIFMNWCMDPTTTALTPDRARDFPHVADHPLQSELKAKHHNEMAAVDKTSTKKKTHKPIVVAVGKKNKVRFFSLSPSRSVDRGRTSKRV